MLNKFKALYNSVGNLDATTTTTGGSASGSLRFQTNAGSMFTLSSNQSEKGPPLKHRYTRPQFLQLNTEDEILVSADHSVRPIIVPRDINRLPWNAGYAETINAGKSLRNEDQASVCRGLLRAMMSAENIANKVADMMPKIPGHPRQLSINLQKSVTTNGHCEAAREDNGPKEGTSNSTPDSGNKVCSQEAAEVPDAKHEVKQSVEKDAVSQAGPSTSEPVDGADLTSPSIPIPPEVVNTPIVENHILKPSLSENSAKKPPALVEESLPWLYFGIFDGHAGSGVSVAASNTLHKLVQEKLQNIADLLIAFGLKEMDQSAASEAAKVAVGMGSMPLVNNGSVVVNHDNHLSKTNSTVLYQPANDKIVTVDSLIVGALESAFWEMDYQIACDKRKYKMNGGCTALVALFILGRLYVANAGDSRAVVYKNNEIIQMSFDFTPESERERIKHLGFMRPEYLGNDFTHLEFIRRPTRQDLGKRLLYRDAFMTGWAYKNITTEDLKVPLIYGEGKRSRVLITIGVTRGFGDHELKAQNSDVSIKPFLTPQPQVRVLDLEKEENLTESDVLILGTDGLWDVTLNEKAAEIVQKSLEHFPANDPQRFRYRYISAAQDLVMYARGKSREGKGWKTQDNKTATIDDISVFVIPLKPYRQEYIKWKEAHALIKKESAR